LSEWIENVYPGKRPDAEFVDIRLIGTNLDTWYGQRSDKWDWQRAIGGIEITHYRVIDVPPNQVIKGME
jgi:hypothetical protein